MEKYIRYCTEEQTRRAYALGVPIETERYVIDDRCIEIKDNVFVHIPTTQQMVGWLENEKNIYLVPIIPAQGIIKFKIYDDNKDDVVGITGVFIKSYDEAELAAIDVALDYLDKELCKTDFHEFKKHVKLLDKEKVIMMQEETKKLCIEWFSQIRNELIKAFPNRETEELVGQRGTEIDTINDIISKCKDSIFYLNSF